VNPSKPLAGIALLLALALAACGKKEAARARPPPLVTTAQPQVRDVAVEIRAPVDLRPLSQADVGSKTLGYLDAVLVDRGDRVKKGQLLALVRPSDLPDQLEAARATYELSKANKDRAEKLAPTGVVSQQELQGAEAAFSSASAQMAVMGVRLGETRITSPLDGVVSTRRLDPGALVGPGAGTSSILTVERIDILRMFIPVNERDVAGLRIGQDARVELDAFPGQNFLGKVVRISPAFDPVTRTLDAEVQIKNPGELRSGMYGRGAIVADVHHGALVLPAGAVQISNDRYWIFLVRSDRAVRREVKVGVDGGDWLEITGGLAPEEEVVTSGMDVLSEGAPVRVQRGGSPYGPAAAADGQGSP
jgi:membrane fusion protein (multidrug efflux system)